MKNLFHLLYCLKCGRKSVPVGFIFPLGELATVRCKNRKCEADHMLRVGNPSSGELEVIYDRYTRKPSFDPFSIDQDIPPIAILETSAVPTEDGISDSDWSGPIVRYRRKNRFTATEISKVWKSSNRCCHICGKKWRLKDKGRYGWHLDHDIPHSSGGYSTELIENFKVACAKCNLKKGRGYSQKQIEQSIGELLEFLASFQIKK